MQAPRAGSHVQYRRAAAAAGLRAVVQLVADAYRYRVKGGVRGRGMRGQGRRGRGRGCVLWSSYWWPMLTGTVRFREGGRRLYQAPCPGHPPVLSFYLPPNTAHSVMHILVPMPYIFFGSVHLPPLPSPPNTGIMYILVPMPYIFFGSAGGDSGYSLSGSNLESGCVSVTWQQGQGIGCVCHCMCAWHWGRGIGGGVCVGRERQALGTWKEREGGRDIEYGVGVLVCGGGAVCTSHPLPTLTHVQLDGCRQVHDGLQRGRQHRDSGHPCACPGGGEVSHVLEYHLKPQK